MRKTHCTSVVASELGVLYVMQNKFNRAPEFIDVYRNLSAHTSKAVEDAASFQLMRAMVGLNQLIGGGCNLTLPRDSLSLRQIKN